MSGKRYFLDTNALVLLGDGDPALGRLVAEADYIGTSVICKLEYLSWPDLPDAIRARFLMMMEGIDMVGLEVADLALHDRIVQIRRSRGGIRLPDAIVMASAQMTDSVLLTRDRQLLNSGLCEVQEF